MDKKIFFTSIIIICMLITIPSFSAIEIQQQKNIEKKEEIPPDETKNLSFIDLMKDLYKENMKSKIIGKRMFNLPFLWLNTNGDSSIRNHYFQKFSLFEVADYWACVGDCITWALTESQVHTILCGGICDSCLISIALGIPNIVSCYFCACCLGGIAAGCLARCNFGTTSFLPKSINSQCGLCSN